MSSSRALKNIVFTAVAQDNHNAVKIKSILKWLKAGHEIRVQINGKSDRQKAMESIYKQIENHSRSGSQVIQKVVKPESIKFYLRPTENAANISIDELNETSSTNIDELMEGKDVFSDEFQAELEESIHSERSKKK